MGRRTRAGRRDGAMPRPKPVEKIELSEKHTKLRLALTILFLVVGITALTYGVSSFFGADPGWDEIQSSAAGTNCGADFTFLYHLGSGGVSAAAEKRAVTALYSDGTEQAYRLFTADIEVEDAEGEKLRNVAYINSHPNEEIQVDEALYKAFSLIGEYGDRSLYLAPVYARYGDLFTCSDDSQTVDFDPYVNPEVAAEYKEAAAYANDRDAVDLELLGGNRVRLKVSGEYAAWAEENGVSRFIDFFWMKNAFIADYLADRLAEGGYVRGCLVSYDGFIRNLDGSGESYSIPVYDRVGQTVYPAAVMQYTGPAGMVYLRDYGMNEADRQRFYRYENGEIRTSYLDAADGLCKSARSDLICYGREQSCARILLEMIPVYVADSFREEAVSALEEKGIFSVYCQDGKVLYNGADVSFNSLYQEGSTAYKAEAIKNER